ncbi:MAG TPA: 50S ribosomal protein L25 [bacterium]|nr:MAG: 50S ribosomal protein L25 [Parcubacteria group bacterium ADurb.Bin115]HNU81475.1 50S ribosomal protein L25 [bacterium]HPW05622.1 50S ribosomal protein L25 [bacterium]HPY99625.1 50S ribosomal protein L25 [bacterium]HQB76604.1 50S ribosomal protein L25 [bacterium]
MQFKLSAEIREKNEKLGQGDLAAVLYGKGLESTILKLNYNTFTKVFAEAGESNLITLELNKQEFPVLVKAVQKDVLKGKYLHIDFYKVDMKAKVKTEIPLEFRGESRAVKELGGVFLVNINEVAVECLPSNLVDHIDVDISGLNEFGDAIYLQDLKLPEGIELMHESNEVICIIEEPKRVEEEVPAAEVPATEATTAKEGEEKTEDKKTEDKK